jgi:hypothetical protein
MARIIVRIVYGKELEEFQSDIQAAVIPSVSTNKTA